MDLRCEQAVRAAIRPETKAIWIETPTNPLMNLVDLAAVAAIARERGLITICDNTFLSPYFQQPLELGIDVVVHSTTKYINGHSDVVGGAVVVKRPDLAERIGYLQNALGTCAGPQDCFLVLRGIKTLAMRMEEHNRNALEIARWLAAHPKISAVLHPGLETHPQHELAKRQMSGYGGTFSFRVKGGQPEVFRLLSAVKLFTLAESLGGVESLIEHPGHHDPRLDSRRGARTHGNHRGRDPRLRRDRRCPRPDRGPRAGARRGLARLRKSRPLPLVTALFRCSSEPRPERAVALNHGHESQDRAAVPVRPAGIESSSLRLAFAISFTARSNASRLAIDGLLYPLIFRTNCSAAFSISSTVAGCPGLRNT